MGLRRSVLKAGMKMIQEAGLSQENLRQGDAFPSQYYQPLPPPIDESTNSSGVVNQGQRANDALSAREIENIMILRWSRLCPSENVTIPFVRIYCSEDGSSYRLEETFRNVQQCVRAYSRFLRFVLPSMQKRRLCTIWEVNSEMTTFYASLAMAEGMSPPSICVRDVGDGESCSVAHIFRTEAVFRRLLGRLANTF